MYNEIGIPPRKLTITEEDMAENTMELGKELYIKNMAVVSDILSLKELNDKYNTELHRLNSLYLGLTGIDIDFDDKPF